MNYLELLEPISLAQPEGSDLSEDPILVEISAESRGASGELKPIHAWHTGPSGWTLVRDLSSKALQQRSKDIRLALWWSEASIPHRRLRRRRRGDTPNSWTA